FVEMVDRPYVSSVQVVVVGDEYGLQNPFGRPGSVVHDVLMRMPGKAVFLIDAIMVELVDIDITLIGNTLAIAVDIDTREGCGLDTILAQFPNRIQNGI